ncbi:segregation and condensation protein A [Streptomyces sedi]|uniref:Segregation and condensation protein A n=1 Tax=Streptomyces sedi TaxID=555059 RepID=A0A5C4URS9_9ACTN|nr:segregation/condensation protein A [Streptomyces sedi]TNM26311.1 segregation/condensation protein A [Streptomyces sedi]
MTPPARRRPLGRGPSGPEATPDERAAAHPAAAPSPVPPPGREQRGEPATTAVDDPPPGEADQAVAGREDPTPAPAPDDDPPAPAEPDGPAEEDAPDDGKFRVVLENFSGPFDLLLQLISRHRLDVTEVALSRVTDDFLAHLRAMGPDGDLDQTTEFLVVAATLLDLKAARLLPTAEVEDEADLALLEARDLLFARLLQYRAFKRVAEIFADRLADESRRHPRTVGLEPHHAELLPDVVIRIGPEGFAQLAVKAMQPKPKPAVYVEHIHAPLVSVREQAEVVVGRLREAGALTFAELTEDAPDTLTVVARFLALLELYRERAVALEQPEALGSLLVRWSGAEPGRALVSDEFDQAAGDGGGRGARDEDGTEASDREGGTA